MQRKYSASECIGARKDKITDNRDPKHVSTFYVERAKPHDAGVNAAVYPIGEGFQQETHKPRVYGRALRLLVQLGRPIEARSGEQLDPAASARRSATSKTMIRR
jgi:hypothetical protein